MQLLSELPVGSLLIYPTTHGTSPASRQAQDFIRYGIKVAKPGKIEHSISRLCAALTGSPLEALLKDPGLLVPVPGSAPRLKDSLWVPERICAELVKQGIGKHSLALLRRVHPVSRSSGVTSAAQRPTPAEHYASLEVTLHIREVSRITLVDDVVTRGSTLIACASHLQETYPAIEIQAFALARTDNTIDLARSIDMFAPAMGEISFNRKTGRLMHKVVERDKGQSV